jgi:hypothetical protein
MIFVPLPRRVGPTAKPPFLRSRKWRRRTLLPDLAFPAHANAEPRTSAPPPTCRCEPTAGTGDGRSDTEGISPASHATAPQFPTPRAHRLAPSAYLATDGHAYSSATLAAAPAQPRPIVHRLIPSLLSRRFAGPRAAPGSHELAHQPFMRQVLGQVIHPARPSAHSERLVAEREVTRPQSSFESGVLASQAPSQAPEVFPDAVLK